MDKSRAGCACAVGKLWVSDAGLLAGIGDVPCVPPPARQPPHLVPPSAHNSVRTVTCPNTRDPQPGRVTDDDDGPCLTLLPHHSQWLETPRLPTIRLPVVALHG